MSQKKHVVKLTARELVTTICLLQQAAEAEVHGKAAVEMFLQVAVKMDRTLQKGMTEEEAKDIEHWANTVITQGETNASAPIN